MRRLLRPVTLALLLLSAPAWATTWFPTEVTCPVCGEKLELDVPGSYGSYIYSWPSRFQLVFWPFTDSHVLHFCKRCHYAAFMGDFAELPKDKVEEVRKAVTALRKPLPEGLPYTEVPMDYRLALAEAAYRALGRDDDFWSHFYRVQGLHLAELGKEAEAREARLRALTLARKLLASGSKEWSAKELTYAQGALEYLTGDQEAALATLARVPQAANHMPREDEKAKETAKKVGAYLDKLAHELAELVRQKKPVPQ